MSNKPAPVANPNDIVELTRAEMDRLVAYLAEKPAKETYNLIKLLIDKPISRFASETTKN